MTHCYQLSINEREEISLGLAQGFREGIRGSGLAI